MSDHWAHKLSEYVDGELSVAEREMLEAHLAECDECAATLDGLRRVVAQASALQDRPPAAELWSGIVERIGQVPAGGKVIDLEERRLLKRGPLGERRVSLALPELVAAGIALMLFSAGTAWLAARSQVPADGVVSARVAPGMVADMPVSSFAAREYGAAIAELERVLDGKREQLDPATVRVLDENLRTIDRAIVQARRALARDPASSFLNDHLAGTMLQKLEFLRHAASIVAAAS